jgi:hypothetical protein
VLADFERAVLAAAGADRYTAALLLLSVFRKRAVSTMRALAISLTRRLSWAERTQPEDPECWRQPSLAFDEDGDDLSNGDASALTADVGLDPRQERAWLKRLITLTAAARRHESKIARLAALLGRSREPVIVFTEFRHSLDAVRQRLPSSRSIAELHGGQTDTERTEQLSAFLSGSASVLLATDVASQGLNLQDRSRWVISLELPWNPARLEQRVGRVDRIGQRRPVHFTLLVADHAAERTVLSRLARRALLAQRALGDDLLRGVPPDVLQLGRTLMTGASDLPQASAPVALGTCTRFRRPARKATRSIEWRRGLGARWRATAQSHGRPCAATFAGRPTIGVFSVSIVDGLGTPIEEHVVAFQLPRSTLQCDRTTALAAARDLASRRMAPHAARVRRWLRRRREESAARERAIVAAIDDGLQSREAQPTLFDRRALRAFEVARDTAAELRRHEREWIAATERATAIVVARPRLVLLLTPATPREAGA